MSAELILGTVFIDRFVKAVDPDQRGVLLRDARRRQSYLWNPPTET